MVPVAVIFATFEISPEMNALPWTANVADGVEVATPTRVFEVSTMNTVLVAAFCTCNAVVELIKVCMFAPPPYTANLYVEVVVPTAKLSVVSVRYVVAPPSVKRFAPPVWSVPQENCWFVTSHKSFEVAAVSQSERPAPLMVFEMISADVEAVPVTASVVEVAFVVVALVATSPPLESIYNKFVPAAFCI